MKNKMMKMMGVVLTLAILAGLLISAVPASAGNLTWDNVVMPSATTSTFQLTQNTQASLFDFAPDGKTVFAYNKSFTGLAGTYGLYKSNDGGVTWTITNVGNSLPTGIVAMAVSPTYATDTTVLAATATTLYRSRNGGQDFLAVITAPVALTGSIVAVDIAPYYISSGGTALLIATTTMIALYSDDLGWRSIATNGGGTPGFTGGTVLTAKFSPTYQSDGEILTVVTNVSAGQIGLTVPGTVLETIFASSAWNATVRPAELVNTSSVHIPSVGLPQPDTASLTFPSDYNSSSSTLNRVYVGLGNSTGATGANYDVWRVNGSVNSTGTVVNATQLKLTDATSSNNASVAYTGTTASGTLVVGQFGTGGAWWATTPNGTAFWTQAANGWAPSGQDVFVAFAPNSTTLYAATNNRAGSGWGSALFTSTDYNSYKAISLISVPDLTKISISQPTGPIAGAKDQFIMLSYTQTGGPPPTPVAFGDVQMIFKSADSGATWAEVFALYNTIAGVTAIPGTVVGQALSSINPTGTYATDNTVYIPQSTNTIWKTTDAGATWNSITSTTPNNSISAFSVIDANTYWLGSTNGGLYKSGSYTQTAVLDGTIPFQIFALPIGLIINTWSGEVYLSNDSGATFTRLGNANQFASGSGFNFRASLAFDIPNKTIYAANSTNNANNQIYKWTIGTDTAWINWCAVTYPDPTSAAVPPAMLTPTQLSLVRAADGTFYIRIPNTTAGTTRQLLRSVNMTAPQGQQAFVGIPQTDSSASSFGNTAGNLPGGKSTYVVNDATASTNTIYQIIGSQPAPYSQNGYPVVIKSFIDTMTGSPTTLTPVAKAQIGTAYTFSWKPVTSPQQVTYLVQIATDDGFNGTVGLPAGGPSNISGQTTATSMYVTNLVPGQSYFLRVSTVLPLPSKWSATVPFTVKLGVSDNQDLTGQLGNRIAPVAGATNVPLSPSFQWAAVTGADSYKIQVADNPGFTSPIADATVKDTFFTVAAPLKPGTTYYWRLQAISGTNASDWVSNVFTTAAPVVAPPASSGTGAPPPVQTINPTIVVTIPPQTPAPVSTPAYIWVIIVIGAILVIAVVVLIARTRRV